MANIFVDTIDWVENYFTQMSNAEFYSTVVIAGAAVFFIIAERIWPYTKGQKILREGFFDDLRSLHNCTKLHSRNFHFHLRNQFY